MREALLPAVVSLLDMEKGSRGPEKWAVSASVYPVAPSDEAEKMVNEAVEAAVAAWGQRQLDELDAEERLSVACEKAPTDDPVIQKIRSAFQKVSLPCPPPPRFPSPSSLSAECPFLVTFSRLAPLLSRSRQSSRRLQARRRRRLLP